MAAVKRGGDALQFASKELQNDRELVLAAVNEYGEALRWASKGLGADRKIVIAAVKEDYNALKYAPAFLQNDKEVALAAVQRYGFALRWASPVLGDDREVVQAALDNVPDGNQLLQFASARLRYIPERNAEVRLKRLVALHALGTRLGLPDVHRCIIEWAELWEQPLRVPVYARWWTPRD